MKTELTEVSVSNYGMLGERAAAGWIIGNARFHVWFNPDTLEHENTIFKNPPLGINPGDNGYFPTRRLQVAAHAETLRRVFEIIVREGMVAAAKKKADSNAERERQEHLERRRLLFEEELLSMFEDDYDGLCEILKKHKLTIVGRPEVS